MDWQSLIQAIIILAALGWLIWEFKNQQIIQNETIKEMYKRVIETETISELYTNLLSDLPNAIERFNEINLKAKDKITSDLEKAAANKDEEIKRLNQLQIEEIESKEKLINGLPKLVKKLIETLHAVDQRLILMGLPARGMSIYDAMIRGYKKESLIDIESLVNSFNKQDAIKLRQHALGG